ncbi:MAG TPA: flavin reductase family protein [bacterium]|nr:flavin reductase family protein [bacterium]
MLKKVDLKYTNRLINHGPLVIVSAENGYNRTFTPIAWNMPVEHSPALIALTIAKENFVNTLIKKSKEFCVNVPSIDYLDLVIKLGGVSGKDTDKVKDFKLKIKKCKKINCHYWSDAIAKIECKLIKTVSISEVDIFIGEALYCSANENFKNDCWSADKLQTVHHLGNLNFVTLKTK